MTGRIFVVHRERAKLPRGVKSLYIGRPSLLGNPYEIEATTGRMEAIRKFEDYFLDMMISSNPAYSTVQATVANIAKWVDRGVDFYLTCWCKPAPCHGDVIKKYIEGHMPELLGRNSDVAGK